MLEIMIVEEQMINQMINQMEVYIMMLIIMQLLEFHMNYIMLRM